VERYPAVPRALGSGGADDTGEYAEIVHWFADGNEVHLSDEQTFDDYEAALFQVPGLRDLAASHGSSRQQRALAAETILEGLYQHLKLAREDLDSGLT